MSKYKSGLDYFSFDIDFFHDQKIEFVSAKYGIEGEIITIKLLCKIYRNGYYLNWGDDECLLFSKKVGENISFELVKNVIDELLKRDFFNQDLYKKFNILTSKGIQKRYLEAAKRRKEVIFYKEHYLLNYANVDIIPDNVCIISKNVDIIPQSKVKESKVENSKEDIKERESQAPSIKKEKELKKEVDPLEFDFKDKCWYGLDDRRIKMFSGKYPNLNINYLLQDIYKTKFLSDPLRYQKEITIAGGVEKLVWMWLGQDEKYRRRKEKGG